MEMGTDFGFVLPFLVLLFLAFKFPIRSIWKSLIPIALGSVLFVLTVIIIQPNEKDLALIFAMIFIPSALTALTVLYFRNKYLDKQSS